VITLGGAESKIIFWKSASPTNIQLKKSATMAPTLSEDEIDDLMYFARTGDKAEFDVLKEELCTREKTTEAELLQAAKDEESGNGVLHMAAANGHSSESTSICLWLA
jgi:hypothetical protein